MLVRSAESDFPRDITRVQSKAAGRAWLTRICYWRLAEESDDPHYSEVRDGQQERKLGQERACGECKDR